MSDQFEHTPNWPDDEERYDCVTISVRIRLDGRGMSRKETEKLCVRLEKTATGRSKRKQVSAIC